MDFNWHVPVFGLIVGLLIGMTGVGGGVLMTPLLMLGLGLPAHTAVGTDLMYATFTKVVGTWQHWRQRTVDFHVARGLAFGSVPASVVAIGLSAWLLRQDSVQANLWMGRAIGLALVLASVLILYRLLFFRRTELREKVRPARLAALVTIGGVAGFMVGFTSIGSGSLVMAFLIMILRMAPENLVGTDIAHATLLVGVAATGHLLLGDVDLPLVLALLLGSIPGVLLGSRMTRLVPRPALQGALVIVLLASAVPLLRS